MKPSKMKQQRGNKIKPHFLWVSDCFFPIAYLQDSYIEEKAFHDQKWLSYRVEAISFYLIEAHFLFEDEMA